MAEKLSPALKPIQPFLVIAKQFVKRDPVVAYYANMYAMQEGIRMAKGDPGAKAYLLTLMDQIETMKSELKNEQAISNDVVAQAHIETVALKLFEFADNEDRSAHFNRNMIKAFFTASHIFTVLKQFGELSVEVEEKMKYSKWKAVEIDRCLKNGIEPTPGPPGEQAFDIEPGPAPSVGFNVQPPPSDIHAPSPSWSDTPPPEQKPVPKPRHTASRDDYGAGIGAGGYSGGAGGYSGGAGIGAEGGSPLSTGVQLGPSEIGKAQKLCNYARSALDYDDVQGALEYLSKAMTLLQTGKDES